MVRKLKAFDCNDLMLDHRGPGALLFVLASDYAALEARCLEAERQLKLLAPVGQYNGHDIYQWEARCAALTAELEECIGNCADPSDKRRIRELEAAIAEAAWIICDHGQCEAVEWALRRGNWEDKYAAKATSSETPCEHEWGEYSIDNAKSPADPPERYVWIKCIKCGEPQAATSNRGAK